MFYDAMRANGEEPWLAKLMYFAVYFFGPHWPKTEALTRERFKEGDIARVARLMQRRKGMDLADIEALTRKALLAQVPDIPHAVQGARALSDSKWIVPVDRDGPCVAPVIP